MGRTEFITIGEHIMKKRMFIFAAALMMIAGLSGCSSTVSYENLDLDEYIKVGKYKDLETSSFTVEVTEDEVQAQIDSELQAAASTEEIAGDDVIAEGDTVNIDYVGKKDGKKFDGGSDEGFDLTIGSGEFIDGFEDGLIGKKVGEKVTLNLTFPEDYKEKSLAGEDVVFEVTINSASREVVPEYDLDFVKNNTDYESIEEYEASIEKTLYDNKESEEIYNQQNDLWSQALENTKVKKYPQDIVDKYMEFNSKQMDDMAENYGMTREEVLASYDFGDEEEFAAVNEDSSKLRVKQEMLIEYIADKEKLEYTEKDEEKLLADFEAMGYNEEMIEAQTGRTMDEYVRIELLYQKVLEFLLDNAVIK